MFCFTKVRSKVRSFTKYDLKFQKLTSLYSIILGFKLTIFSNERPVDIFYTGLANCSKNVGNQPVVMKTLEANFVFRIQDVIGRTFR